MTTLFTIEWLVFVMVKWFVVVWNTNNLIIVMDDSKWTEYANIQNKCCGYAFTQVCIISQSILLSLSIYFSSPFGKFWIGINHSRGTNFLTHGSRSSMHCNEMMKQSHCQSVVCLCRKSVQSMCHQQPKPSRPPTTCLFLVVMNLLLLGTIYVHMYKCVHHPD